MKFPKILSPERLYLLSPEDRKIYEEEHRFDHCKSVQPTYIPINETQSYYFDDEIDSLEEAFEIENRKIQKTLKEDSNKIVDNFVDSLINEELESIFEDFADELSRDEFDSVKEEYFRMLREEEGDEETEAEDPEDFSIDETDSLLVEGQAGYDCTEWIRGLAPKVGWLGKLVGAGLTALGMGLGYLITVGKDKLAMKKLKKYMNRLVEVTDQGVHKKRPWYTVLLPRNSKAYKNTGEYNTGCFRSIQENVDRDICVNVMVGAKKLGFFNEGQMMSMVSGGRPQEGGGIMAFKTNVIDKLTFLK